MLEKYSDEKLNKVVTDYLSKLESKISIEKAILYGSYARGNATELSDIDLLIISSDLPENTPKGKNGFYLDNLVGDFDPSLEIIAVNPTQLNNSVEKGFFDEIINTGKVVYPNGNK